MADRPRLDEATRPRAPQHPDAERTASGAASAEMLVSVHAHLRSELEQIRDVIAEVATGRIAADTARSLINDMSMRQNYWSLGAFCATFCRVLTVHHTIEDVSVFPSLKTRDPELGPVIDRLVEEHEVVAEVLTRLDLALVAMVGHPESLSAVKAEVDRLSEVLLSHLAYEEEELIGPINRLGMEI